MNIERTLMSPRVARSFKKYEVMVPMNSRLAISEVSLRGIIPLTFTA